MADPFVAKIRIFPFNFAPTGWAFCDGQLLPISQNTALFALLGTMYGGDGKATFALPNLQGSVPVGAGQGEGLSEYFPGDSGGSENVTLLQSEMPAHAHSYTTSRQIANSNEPVGKYFAKAQGVGYLNDDQQPTTTMSPATAGIAGSSLPHNNMMPSTVLSACIAMVGIFPPRG